MVDPSSEQKRVRYDRLLADANEVFDLWWLNEELTERLFNESKFGFNGFVSWHRSWYEDAELYFASQYLLSYHDAQCEIAAIVDEEMPRDYYGRLSPRNWARPGALRSRQTKPRTAPIAGRFQPSTSSVSIGWARMMR